MPMPVMPIMGRARGAARARRRLWDREGPRTTAYRPGSRWRCKRGLD